MLTHEWQYGPPVPLAKDMVVVVRMEQPRGFLLGSIINFSQQESTCMIKVANQPDAVFQSSLLGLMVLEQPRDYQLQDPSWFLDIRVQSIHISPKVSWDASASSSTSSKSIEQFREAKLRALVLVRELLQRKEQLIASLAKLNDRARQQTPSSRRDCDWSVANNPDICRHQHAWLSENLQVTNHSLRQAFTQLQQVCSLAQHSILHILVADALTVALCCLFRRYPMKTSSPCAQMAARLASIRPLFHPSTPNGPMNLSLQAKNGHLVSYPRP